MRALVSCLFSFLLIFPFAAAPPARAAESVQCSALAKLVLSPASMSLPTNGAHVVSVGASEDTDPNGAFCKVLGVISPVDASAPEIRFELNLPSKWNGKAVHFGGGGYDGNLVEGLQGNFLGHDGGRPVGRGYATFGSDSGHQIASASAADMAAFALNDEALANFSGAQLKKVHDAALAIIRRHYHRMPRRLYFYGSSQGGHEGLIVAQHWPRDYDGVVAIHPAYDFTALQLGGLYLAQTLYRSPGAWLSAEKVSLLADAAMTACDALDGVKDGIISNVQACRRIFQPVILRCPGGKDSGSNCLSDEQLLTVGAFAQPAQFGFSLSGVSSFAHWPLLEGAYSQGDQGRFGLGVKAVPDSPPGRDDAFVYVMADQMVRFMLMRSADYPTLQFKPLEHVRALQALSATIDASDPNLDLFRQRGGRLLLMHGTSDMAISPYNTVAYHESLVGRYGTRSLEGFVRFYLAPGFGHGDGAFQVAWDSLGTIDAWVDKGRAPVNQTVVDTSPQNAGRSRPLCEYPAWPRYTAGDPEKASSFRCSLD